MDSAVTKTDISSQGAESDRVAPSTAQSTLHLHRHEAKKSVDYRTMNQNDVLEDMQTNDKESSLLIPEIITEAPTPKTESPSLSPKPESEERFFPVKKDFVLKYNEEDTSALLTKQEMDRVLGLSSGEERAITEEDWDRMETLAERERLVQQNTEQNEQNENRIKLNKFRENPKVDIAKSRLADELKIILDEAQKRIQDKNFPNTKLKKITKRGKKKQKEVTFSNKKSIMNKNVGKFYDVTEDDNIKEALMKVEQKIVDNPEQDLDDDVNDSSLLNGFMEGFEEEDNTQEISTVPEAISETNHFATNRCVLITGAFLLIGVGSVILWHRLRQ